MYNYTKKLLLIFSILLMPSMNTALKAMEDNETYGNSPKHAHKARPSQAANLKDSTTSWASDLLSPVKRIARGTYQIVDYTWNQPHHALVAGLLIASQFVIATEAQPFIFCLCECKHQNGTINKHKIEWREIP